MHREMFEGKFSFHGSFMEGCQRDVVPQSLLIMVNDSGGSKIKY